MQLAFRNAIPDDLEKISELVRHALMQMDLQGIKQWDEQYPADEDYKKDIERNQLYADTLTMKSRSYSA